MRYEGTDLVMVEMLNGVSENIEVVLLATAGLTLLLLLGFIVALAKIAKLNKKYQFLQTSYENGDIAKFLDEYIDKIEKNTERILELENLVNNLFRKQKKNIQKIGLEKYNAFDDMGGNLSYAIAILDEENTGVIISSIFSRTDSRNYVRKVKNGKSDQQLSDEENAALNKAEKS